ncbi:hypothetical protein [Spirosoma flavum]|uniref:DUF4251 domain-containing protein n=1 Tax=Spirosoma flavum TaxID=2048557 RepID=A0ABW6ASB2_9BACT
MKFIITIFLVFTNSLSFSQISQDVSVDFIDRLRNNGKLWAADSPNSNSQVQQVINEGPGIKNFQFVDNKIRVLIGQYIEKGHERMYRDAKYSDSYRIRVPKLKMKYYKQNLTCSIEPGTVDPLLKLSNGNVYEVRFLKKNQLRLRHISSTQENFYAQDYIYSTSP